MKSKYAIPYFAPLLLILVNALFFPDFARSWLGTVVVISLFLISFYFLSPFLEGLPSKKKQQLKTAKFLSDKMIFALWIFGMMSTFQPFILGISIPLESIVSGIALSTIGALVFWKFNQIRRSF